MMCVLRCNFCHVLMIDYWKRPAHRYFSMQACLLCSTQIMIIVFGQQLPDADAGLAAQLFGVAAASTGLASFALVLALVEQVCCCCACCTDMPASLCWLSAEGTERQ
jgi:hypothetical protein